MSSSHLILLVPVLGLCVAPSLAQVSVKTNVVEVQTVGACAEFKYPKAIRAQNYRDVHHISGGGAFTEILQAQVADEISRSGSRHNAEELQAANYKRQPNGALQLDFRIGRQATFKFCINPGIARDRGLVMTYDTQIRDLTHTIRSDKKGPANQYISASKAQEVDADNEAFKREVGEAIKALRDEFAARRDRLERDEAGLIFDEAGYQHPVLVTFAEQSEEVTVKVRTPQ